MDFNEWKNSVESEHCVEFGGSGIRDVYTLPNGVKLHDEVFLPKSVFRSQHNQTMVDIVVHRSIEQWLENEYSAEIDYHRYSPEHYGYPLFVGENSLERAYNFAMKEYGKFNKKIL